MSGNGLQRALTKGWFILSLVVLGMPHVSAQLTQKDQDSSTDKVGNEAEMADGVETRKKHWWYIDAVKAREKCSASLSGATFMKEVRTNFCQFRRVGSPLVLDLDNDSTIELTKLDDHTESFFDIDEDGFAEQIAWVSPDDGLLVQDQNGNGRIDDAGDLFGSIFEDGFAQLARLDVNDDGVVDHADPDFSNLLIWRDSNGDGISDPKELHQLSAFSISAIHIEAKPAKTTNAGNLVSHTSTYEVRENGRTENRIVHDIWFRYDDMNVRYIGGTSLDDRVRSLPNLRGYGIIPDLAIAMSSNYDDPGGLREQVSKLQQIEFEEIFEEDRQIVSLLRETLFMWAELRNLIPDSRGPFVDARELVFLEFLTDQPYLQREIHSNPFVGAGEGLSRLFEYVLEHYNARLLSQLVGEELFRFEHGYTLDPGSKPDLQSAYNLRSDDFEGVSGLRPSGLKALETIAGATEDPDYAWDIALRMIEFSVGLENLPPEDLALLSQSLLASGASSLATHSMAIQTVADNLLDVVVRKRLRGKRMTDTDDDGRLVGTPEKDFLVGDHDDEVFEGRDGADEIRGNGGNDRLIGQNGSDYLLGGLGDDVYVFGLGSGIEVINEGNDNRGHDVIELGAGITLEDLVFERRGNTDLLITLRDSPLDAVLIENQFNANTGLEVLRFASGTEEDLVTRNYIVNGTSFNDKLSGITTGGSIDDGIRGFGGNDVLSGKRGNDMLDGGSGDDRILGDYGTDVLIGGPGNDLLRGGAGNDELGGGAGDDEVDGGLGDDLYRYESGNDRFIDSRGSSDRLIVENVHSTDVTFVRMGKDLKIVLHEGGSLLLSRHFAGAQIETISFSDTSLDSSSIEYTEQGDAGNDQ
jgi:Ca2+-binding RTX toxin-like protein